MKKTILTIALALILVVGLENGSQGVKAVNIPYSVVPWTSSVVVKVLQDANLRTPGFWQTHRYFSYVNTSNGEWVFTIVPRTSTVQVVYWWNTKDADLELDRITVQYNCSVSAPCISYMYTNAGVWTRTYTRTTNLAETQVDQYQLAYTNVMQIIRYWYFDGSEFLSMDSTDFATWNYGYYGQGMPQINLADAQTAGLITGTDQEQTNQLIDANWGMFNWLKDGLNSMFSWVVSVLEGLAQGIWDALPQELTDIIAWVWDLLNAIVLIIFMYLGRLLQFIQYLVEVLFPSVFVPLTSLSTNIMQLVSYIPAPLDTYLYVILNVAIFSILINIAWYVISLGQKK